MNDMLSLHDADRIAEENAPVPRPGLFHLASGIIRHPHTTLTEVLDHPVQIYSLVLAALGGVYWVFNLAVAQASGAGMGLPALLASFALLGGAAGLAYMFALSILINWSCDLLGGRPSRRKIRMLLAVAGLPGIVALLLFGIPKIAIFGSGLFLPERAWLDANPMLVWGLWFGDALCFAWSLFLVISGLKIINGFSTGRATMAALLPLGPIALIAFLFILIVWTGVFFAPPAF